MDSNEYQSLESKFLEIRERFRSGTSILMDIDTEEAVQHYLDHAELEMAVELFCLDLIKNSTMDAMPSVTTKRHLFDLVKDLGFLEDSVFDGNFGQRFIEYTNSE